MHFLTKTEAFQNNVCLRQKPLIGLPEESSDIATSHACALAHNRDVALDHILRRGLLTHKVKADKRLMELLL